MDHAWQATIGCRIVVCPIRADNYCPPSTNGICPELSGVVRISKDLIWLAFRRVGFVRIFVQVVRYPDKGACPKGRSDKIILSGLKVSVAGTPLFARTADRH